MDVNNAPLVWSAGGSCSFNRTLYVSNVHIVFPDLLRKVQRVALSEGAVPLLLKPVGVRRRHVIRLVVALALRVGFHEPEVTHSKA